MTCETVCARHRKPCECIRAGHKSHFHGKVSKKSFCIFGEIKLVKEPPRFDPDAHIDPMVVSAGLVLPF